MKRELITGDVVRLERDRVFQGAPPDLERLLRQSVDEIDRDRFETCFAGDLEAAPRLLRSMAAAEKPQGFRVERLNPSRPNTDA